MKSNITFIGMPGCGKSTYGKAIARELNLSFIDGDDLIRDEVNMPLKDYIEKEGTKKFVELEDKIHMGINCESTVISPGGSICYCEKSMNHLKDISKIVYLKVSRDEIHRRVPDPKARGVAMESGETFDDVFDRRTPLYEKYADIVIDVDDDNYERIIEEIKNKIK